MARTYFQDLFNFDYNSNIDNILHLIPKCITRDMNFELLKPVKDKEILRAFDQMDSRKAPGSDGLSIKFFREN